MKKFLTIIISLLFAGTATCQVELTGTLIYDDGEAVIGAEIIELYNPQNITISDFDRNFSITVADTSSIRISQVGLLDKIIVVANYQYDTITMNDDYIELETVLPHSTYYKSYSIKLLGDVNRMPYGIGVGTYQSRLFNRNVNIGSSITCKTDFNNNTHLTFYFGKDNIIDIRNYELLGLFYFNLRDISTNLTDYRVNDYDLIAYNYIFNRYYISGGARYRDFLNSNSQWGYNVGVGTNISKINLHLYSSITFIEDNYEYEISAYYDLLRKSDKDLSLGLKYIKFIPYDEFNISLQYTFN